MRPAGGRLPQEALAGDAGPNPHLDAAVAEADALLARARAQVAHLAAAAPRAAAAAAPAAPTAAPPGVDAPAMQPAAARHGGAA